MWCSRWKSLGLDGFPAKFYQVFWDIIKVDLLVMFTDFFEHLPLLASILELSHYYQKLQG
jgi:hypothetical protein